jgi:hypothetical protein
MSALPSQRRQRTGFGMLAVCAFLSAPGCAGEESADHRQATGASCTSDSECAAGDSCRSGQCIRDDAGAQADGAAQCVRAPCGSGHGPCCTGFECKSVELYNCMRATRDAVFCNQTDWTGTCHAENDVPCDPAAIGLSCPNIPIFGPAPPTATCCAPLGGTGEFACVDPSSNPAFCSADGGAPND